MSRILARRRASVVLVLSLATVVLIGAVAAIGIAATQEANTIELELFPGNTGEFRYEGASQALETSGRRCELSSNSINGDIMVLRGFSYDKQGDPVDPAPVGIVGQRLGVDKGGNGRDSSCGRIDSLDRGNEILKLALGSGVDQLIERAALDIEAGANETIEFTYLKDGEPFGTNTTMADGNGQATARIDDVLFDELWISTPDGNIAVLGGVFYLAYGTPDVAIDVVTNGADPVPTVDDPNYITAANVEWTYTLTNSGEGPAAIDSITDTPDDSGFPPFSPTYSDGDTDGDGLLDTTETWTYLETTAKVRGTYGNSATVAVVGPDSDLSNNTDTSGYFGVVLDIAVDKKTSGTNESSPDPYVGPGDDVLIVTGDTVTWSYVVTNNSNVPLSDIRVIDDREGRATCSEITLLGGETTTVPCTLTGTAEESSGVAFTDGTFSGGYTNTATAYGTPPFGVLPSGAEISSVPSVSSYFGMFSNLEVTVTNDGIGDPPVVSEGMVTWTVSVKNNGNTEVNLITATEDLLEGGACGLVGSLLPGESDSCEIEVDTLGGPQERTFTATGVDPAGKGVGATSLAARYYGGLGCGEVSPEAGEAGPVDAPHAIFVIGPDKFEVSCAVPVEVTSSTDGIGAQQEATVGPPTGWNWGGVTGVFTVEWDVEVPPPDNGIARTLQAITVDGETEETVVPWCAEVVPVRQVTGEWYYELIDDTGLYDEATPAGDSCLILQNTSEVNVSGTVYTKTTEAFYIWNDPKFLRK